jgi:hypothetical protein
MPLTRKRGIKPITVAFTLVPMYLHSPNTPSWRGAQLKHRDNFTFTFYLCNYTMLYCMLERLCDTFIYLTSSVAWSRSDSLEWHTTYQVSFTTYVQIHLSVHVENSFSLKISTYWAIKCRGQLIENATFHNVLQVIVN